MNNFIFGKQFTDFIQSMMNAKIVSGGKEIVTRCKYCADSKDPNSPGHMYIKIPQTQNDPILFHCFKCQTSGILDSRTLLEWGIYDPSIAIEADKVNASAAKHRNFTGISKQWFPFNNHIYDTNLALVKLNYINNRIGTNLTIDDCMKQKIILNLKDAIDYNNLQYTRNQNIVQQLNDHFVGFLSLDNNFVNLRKMCNDGIVYSGIDKRYINYNIHGKEDNTEKMYIMPSYIDLSIPTKVQIHVAEGPFDILSIRYNLRGNQQNSIFAAVTGSGYKGLINHIITSFKIFYFDLHIYPDNDKFGSDHMINDIAQMIKPYGATIYEHRNCYDGEKDFGVPSYRINEKVYPIYPY